MCTAYRENSLGRYLVASLLGDNTIYHIIMTFLQLEHLNKCSRIRIIYEHIIPSSIPSLVSAMVRFLEAPFFIAIFYCACHVNNCIVIRLY